MKKNLKSVLSIALVLLLIAVTGLTFAYWDRLTETKDNTIAVGQGKAIEVEVAVEATGGKLIPKGNVLGVGEVDEVVYKYNVRLDQEVQYPLNLFVDVTDVKIGGSLENGALVDFEISQNSETINNTDVLVTVIVTLNEPDDEPDYQQYYEIINQDITFTLIFQAE